MREEAKQFRKKNHISLKQLKDQMREGGLIK